MQKEFKAEKINGKLIVKAIIEKVSDGHVKVHVPSLALIAKAEEEFMKNDKRNLQQV